MSAVERKGPMRRIQLREAAQIAGCSVATLTRAIHTTDPTSFPPPLAASRLGASSRARYLVREDVLAEWIAVCESRYPV